MPRRDGTAKALKLTPPPLSGPPKSARGAAEAPGRRLSPLSARPPAELEPAAAAEWKRLARQLVKREPPATVLDADALAAYCRTLVRWREAEAQVRELGLVIKNELGHAVPNPFLSIAVTAARELGRLSKALGLTPAARGEVKSAK